MSNISTLLIGAVAKTNIVTTEPLRTWTSLPFINIVTRGKQRGGGGTGVRENIIRNYIIFKITYYFVSRLS